MPHEGFTPANDTNVEREPTLAELEGARDALDGEIRMLEQKIEKAAGEERRSLLSKREAIQQQLNPIKDKAARLLFQKHLKAVNADDAPRPSAEAA